MQIYLHVLRACVAFSDSSADIYIVAGMTMRNSRRSQTESGPVLWILQFNGNHQYSFNIDNAIVA